MRGTHLPAALLCIICCVSSGTCFGTSYPPLYPDAEQFRNAIGRAKADTVPQRVTGITVPHHLLAADLIAESFARVANREVTRIIILSPDHFFRSSGPFAVTTRDFRTPLGLVRTDVEAVKSLLQEPSISESDLFSHEHGVRALLPFVAHYFPGSRIVPIAISPASKPGNWDTLVSVLKPLVSENTLVIQSADFSHHLTQNEARQKDQETLRILSLGKAQGVSALTEPYHLDSRAAQYVQMRIQVDLFGAGPTVMASRNSQEYSTGHLDDTTSYIVQYYSSERLDLDNAERFFFAGDAFFGRYVADILADKDSSETLAREILSVTLGQPLIVNLEGVIADRCPENLGAYELCMERDSVIPLLKNLNVIAVSLANNHARDLGTAAYVRMKRMLSENGIAVMEHGKILDFGRFSMAAFTDLDNTGTKTTGIIGSKDADALAGVSRDKPLFAFVHWGTEFSKAPGLREQYIEKVLSHRGVEFIIGAHSHSSSALECSKSKCNIFSAGNLIFDQIDPKVDGKIVEVAFFPQGTYFVRLHELGNLYGKLSRMRRSQDREAAGQSLP